eukprot:g4455.t1
MVDEAIFLNNLREFENVDSDYRSGSIRRIYLLLQQKNIELSNTLEKKISRALLDRLKKDEIANVLAGALEAISELILRASDETLSEIFTTMSAGLVDIDGSTTSRSTFEAGMRQVIDQAPLRVGAAVSAKTCENLLRGVQNKDERASLEQLSEVSFMILSKFVIKFSTNLDPESQQNVKRTFLANIGNTNSSMSAAAVESLGPLARGFSSASLRSVIEDLSFSDLAKESSEAASTCLEALGSISKSVGYRMGPCLENLVPLLLKKIGDTRDSDAQIALRVAAFEALASFVKWCKVEVQPFIDEIVEKSVSFMQFDPNFEADVNYSDSSTWKVEGIIDNDDFNDNFGFDNGFDDFDVNDFDDGGFGDEEIIENGSGDRFWKVRMSAVMTLHQVISSRPDMLKNLVSKCGALLCKRFSERHLLVKAQVIKCFSALLKASVVVDKINSKEESSVGIGPPSAPTLERLRSSVDELFDMSKSIVKAACEHIDILEGHVCETPAIMFQMLQRLVDVLSRRKGGMIEVEDMLPELCKQITKSLDLDGTDSGTIETKVAALDLACIVLRTCPLSSLATPCLTTLVPSLTSFLGEASKNITSLAAVAAGLRAYKVLIIASRPLRAKKLISVDGINYSDLGETLSTVVLGWLQKKNIGIGTKTEAIRSAATVLARLGDMPPVKNVSSEIMKRFVSLMTRDTVVPVLCALHEVASSPLIIDFPKDVLQDIESRLSNYLIDKGKQQRRDVKISALYVLVALTQKLGEVVTIVNDESSMNKLSAYIDDEDVTVAALVLRLGTASLQSKNGNDAVLRKAKALLASPLVQGNIRTDLFDFFTAFASAYPDMCQAVVNDCINAVLTKASRQNRSLDDNAALKSAISNTAACVARLLCQQPQGVDGAIDSFVAGCNSAVPEVACLYLRLIGEIGHFKDDIVGDVVLAKFSKRESRNASEDVNRAAAFALGSLAVGNADKFLPHILCCFSDGSVSSTDYALLSLHRLIDLHENFAPYAEAAVNALCSDFGRKERTTRNHAAECLAKLAVLEPGSVAMHLKKMTDVSSKTNTRAVAAITLRLCVQRYNSTTVGVANRKAYACASAMEVLTPALSPAIDALINLARVKEVKTDEGEIDWERTDEELQLKVEIIKLVTALAKHQPSEIRRLIGSGISIWESLLPHGLGCTRNAKGVAKKDKGFIEYTKLGNFKVENHHGKDCIFATMDLISTLVRSNPECAVINSSFLELCEKAAADNDELISEHALLMTSSILSETNVPADLLYSTGFVQRLGKVITRAKPEEAADLRQLRAAVQCAFYVSEITGVQEHASYQELLMKPIDDQPVAKDVFMNFTR